MKVSARAADLHRPGQLTSLAIGVFDGLHLGHQAVIDSLLHHARASAAHAIVVTFDRHPNSVVAPARNPRLIQTLDQRLRSLAQLGVEATWVIPFDAAFSQLTGEQFIHTLNQSFGPISSIHVGDGFHFGHSRSGHVDLLRQLGASLGFATHALAAVILDGHPVSSTRIREAIRHGHLDQAGRFLNRTYSLEGRVIRGDQQGRTLGFPTANLETDRLVLPPTGVYAARAHWGQRHAPAVLNIGHRPTITPNSNELRVEAHLLDVEVDLYGQSVEVFLAQRLRPEHRFESVEALAAQIRQDVATARHCLRHFRPVRLALSPSPDPASG